MCKSASIFCRCQCMILTTMGSGRTGSSRKGQSRSSMNAQPWNWDHKRLWLDWQTALFNTVMSLYINHPGWQFNRLLKSLTKTWAKSRASSLAIFWSPQWIDLWAVCTQDFLILTLPVSGTTLWLKMSIELPPSNPIWRELWCCHIKQLNTLS